MNVVNVVVFSTNPRPDWLVNLIKELKLQFCKVNVLTYGHSELKPRTILEYLLQKRAEVIIINADCGAKDAEAYNLLEFIKTTEDLESLISSKNDLPQVFRLAGCLNHLNLIAKPSPPIICVGEQMEHPASDLLELWGVTKKMLPTDSLLLNSKKLIATALSAKSYIEKTVANLYKKSERGLQLLSLDDFNFEEEGDDY
ncbi:hypothetical protein COT94_02815 [Candidatus Falkowbacteria bacterium CG10_big_fil_rev_8_21_14_0_10_37_14]|uniref:Uncharacterized protein n=1 Tax=Candidatus Falkowbacteria bacterium CG10_big_fil_rev_8_21_14_0_10_37_14 TaxID=1974561 RepID=A0A2M6WT78_9BACT|nr:MAG: hypothetical protein COT94_02815 [Candidatus Falkowbacteria bacterium CG10_big_fil_rev_8_21_14_0_10_37_14]